MVVFLSFFWEGLPPTVVDFFKGQLDTPQIIRKKEQDTKTLKQLFGVPPLASISNILLTHREAKSGWPDLPHH